MKVVAFTIPVAHKSTVVVQVDKLPFFYNYLHRHTEMQLTLILEGDGTLIAGDYMQPFKKGDVYLIGGNQAHIFKNSSEYFESHSKKQVHSVTLFFNPKGLLRSVLELPEMKHIQTFLTTATNGLQFPPKKYTLIADLIQKIQKAKPTTRLILFLDLLDKLAALEDLQPLASASTTSSFTEQEGLRMNDIYKYTMDHYTDNITLEQIAGIAHLTPQAFCRYFKKHTRKTYVTFLNEVRISEACKRIVSTNFTSISAVAFDSGFSSAVSFNRVFKKITGKSPKQYQKEYMQKAF